MQNRKSVEVTASNDSPAISTSDMKTFLRVSDSADDAIIASYVAMATEYAKNYTRRGILTETFLYRMDSFCDFDADDALVALGSGVHTGKRSFVTGSEGVIELPYLPIASITSINTYDNGNNQSTLTSAAYLLDAQGGRIVLNDGYTWPTDLRDYNAVEVTYVAGYGSGNVPEQILQAIRMMVSNLYEGCAMAPADVDLILSPYKLYDTLEAI